VVQACQSGFSFLAADPLSVAGERSSPAATLTSSPKTRVRGFSRCTSGRPSSRRRFRPINTPGLRPCAYKRASGRREWLNRDPIGDLGFIILTGHVPVRGAVDPNLFLFVANKPVNAIDALGLTLWYCTVPTKGFPLFGLGRHGYLWNDATGDECGQESSCGSGSTSSNNGGPGPGDTNPTRSGRVCTQIDGSQGADASNAALMAWCHQHANDGAWVPGAHDCHNVVNKCLKQGNLGGVDPGRFHPQPIFSPIPGLSSAVP
jgi:hypothetical protein